MMKTALALISLSLVLAVSALKADPFYVNPVKGNDAATGTKDTPFKTLARAVREIDGVGGEIHLQPDDGFYTESLNVAKGGQPDKPLIIDGHGAVINLGIDVTKGPWTDTGAGYRLERPVTVQTRINLVTVGWVNGLPVFSDDPTGHRPQAWHGGSAHFDAQGHLILVFPRGLTPANSVVVLNGGSNGFMSCAVSAPGGAYIQIRNLTAAFSANDGFNFHGKGHDVLLDNVKGLFSGDQGTSAHEAYQVNVQNSEFAFNGSGDAAIEDVKDAVTTYKNVRAHQNRNMAFLFMQGHHVLDQVVSFENGTSNLPKASEFVEIKDCQDLGQIGEDKQIPVVADPNAPVDPKKPVDETDRLGRFLQLRPAPTP